MVRLETCDLLVVPIAQKGGSTFAAMTCGVVFAIKIRIKANISSRLPQRLLPVGSWALREQWPGIRINSLDREPTKPG